MNEIWKIFDLQYSAAADTLSDDIRIQFAGVDCGPYKQLCNMYDVAGFPTILYFNYGKNEQKYQGARSQEAFTAFMEDPVRGLAEFQNSNQIEEASVDETWDVPGGELVTQFRLSATFHSVSKSANFSQSVG